MERIQTDVLIIGAGPTGLMAANQFMRFGIGFIIIDLKDGPTHESRAIAVTPRSMEIYQQLGLSDTILLEAMAVRGINAYSQGRRKAFVPVAELSTGLSDFPAMLCYEQSKNEQLLLNNLLDHNCNVQWKSKFLNFTESDEHIEVEIDQDGKKQFIDCKYLYGCDGARSLVRKKLNFEFPGGTYDNLFFVADTKLTWPIPYDQLVISPGDLAFTGFFPLYGNQHYRVIGTLPTHIQNIDTVSFDDLKETVKLTLGLDVTFEEVNWFSTYKLHHRMTKKFRKGRVFIGGDSAHIHSPAGGQGMNTGLQDAYNLAWKLAFVLKGFAQERLLDTYEEERLPFAKWLLNFTDRGFRLMSSRNKIICFIRKHILLNLIKFVSQLDPIRKKAIRTVTQIGWNYRHLSLSKSKHQQSLSFQTGDRLPYLVERDLYSYFTKPCFHVLHIGYKELTTNNRQRILSLFPFPVEVVEQPLDNVWVKLGVKEEVFILVRPDNYIAYICETLDNQEFQNYLEEFFICAE